MRAGGGEVECGPRLVGDVVPELERGLGAACRVVDAIAGVERIEQVAVEAAAGEGFDGQCAERRVIADEQVGEADGAVDGRSDAVDRGAVAVLAVAAADAQAPAIGAHRAERGPGQAGVDRPDVAGGLAAGPGLESDDGGGAGKPSSSAKGSRRRCRRWRSWRRRTPAAARSTPPATTPCHRTLLPQEARVPLRRRHTVLTTQQRAAVAPSARHWPRPGLCSPRVLMINQEGAGSSVKYNVRSIASIQSVSAGTVDCNYKLNWSRGCAAPYHLMQPGEAGSRWRRACRQDLASRAG